jgi:hypothetical protein
LPRRGVVQLHGPRIPILFSWLLLVIYGSNDVRL